jgi:hypothetical protein
LIDPRGPRTAAAVTTVVLAVVLLTGSAALLAVQAVVFALGAVGRSPYVALYRRLVRPRIGPPAELEAAQPVRFAQVVGLVFALVGVAGGLLGLTAVLLAATALALAAAFLNAAFGFCLGCEMYLTAIRLKNARTREGAPT